MQQGSFLSFICSFDKLYSLLSGTFLPVVPVDTIVAFICQCEHTLGASLETCYPSISWCLCKHFGVAKVEELGYGSIFQILELYAASPKKVPSSVVYQGALVCKTGCQDNTMHVGSFSPKDVQYALETISLLQNVNNTLFWEEELFHFGQPVDFVNSLCLPHPIFLEIHPGKAS